jgi:signal transduction histidine kinase
VERAARGRAQDAARNGTTDVWAAPLPAGLQLEVRRTLPEHRTLAAFVLAEVRRRWPAGRPLPALLIPAGTVAVAGPFGPDARSHELVLPGGTSTPILIVHPEGASFAERIETRRNWTIAGVVALLVLVALGLHLTLRALSREREARRLKDDFLANVSHELRTPLTSVCLHADLLAEGPLPDAQRRAHAEVVRAEGARLSALVDDLLDFAARERGARRLDPAPVDVSRAVVRAVEPFRVLAEREGVVLTVETAVGEVSAMADPLALERILGNLLGNAWKHGRPSRDGAPGRIRVAASSTAGGAEVLVRDDGQGIPASERTGLFERFHRGAGAAKTRGVGLGLALSRDLARALGGDLVLVGDPDATVFRLTLPPVPPVVLEPGASVS